VKLQPDIPSYNNSSFNSTSHDGLSYSTLPTSSYITALSSHALTIADTGSTGHFLSLNTPCSNVVPTTQGLSVRMPNGTHITSSHTCDLYLPGLPPAALQAHIFPDLTSGPLLSIGQLCDHGCQATFDKFKVTIRYGNAMVLRGPRNPTTGLWYVDVTQPTVPTFPAQALSAYQTSTLPELIQFLHATCFSPAQSTFIAAIQAGYLLTWPGLTAALVAKYLPKSLATAKGHLDQQRKNIRSTHIPEENDIEIFSHDPESTHLCFASVIDAHQDTGKMYSDITGRFPVQSSRGHKYIFVLYDYDSNAILVEPIKSRAADELLRAFTTLHTRLLQAGRSPSMYFLDNEASTLLKEQLRKLKIQYQLVPPHMHRRNAAERAIRTFKNHFMAGRTGKHRY
jgi:hypothetical protein